MTIFKGDVTWGFQAVRSSYCVNGDCVEVSVGAGRAVLVRDSKDPGTVQEWEPWEWTDLLTAVRAAGPVSVGAGPAFYGYPGVEVMGDGDVWLGIYHRHPLLEFSLAEWNAFVAGVLAGEFDYLRLSSPALVGPTSGRTAAAGAVEPGQAPAPVAAGGDRKCVTCGKPTILGRYIDGALLVMDAEPVTDGQAVLKGDHADVPVVLFGIDDEHDADFWGVPFESDRYDRHECASTPDSAVAGPNVASMYVPAGRDLESNPMPVIAVDAVATTGQPGSDLLDEILDRLWSVERMALLAYRAAKGMERVAGPPDVPAGDVDELLRKGAEPLVRFDPPDTSHAAVGMGWARPDGLVNEAGEVGPVVEHPLAGPTEPAEAVRS